MSPIGSARPSSVRLAELACALAASAAILVYVGVAVTRLAYPYELEWQEGGVLDHVRRVASERPLYAEPSLEFIAFPYTPLYYWIAAALSGVFGESFTTLRAISFASSLASLALLFRLAQRETGSPKAGLYAAGLYAATFRFAGAWFDVARVDSLSMAWLLAAVYVLRWRIGVLAALTGAALFFLAFFTKQTALAIAPFVAVAIASRSVRDRRSGRDRRNVRDALVFTGALAILVGASTIAIDATSDGWYSWYVFELLAGHAWNREAAIGFGREILASLWAPLLLVVAARRAAGGWFGAWTAAGLVAAAWIGRAHVGGYDNTLIPACAAIAWRFGPALNALIAKRTLAATGASLLALIAFAVLAYDPRAQVPTSRDRAAGDRLVARIRSIESDAYVPHHGYLARRAGKSSAAHAMAVIDLLSGSDREVASRFVKELEAALASRKWSAIVLDEAWHEDLPFLARFYSPVETLFAVDDPSFYPVTGDRRRPTLVYAPREAK